MAQLAERHQSTKSWTANSNSTHEKNNSISHSLKKELEELIADAEFASNLKVDWKPGQDSARDGEVKGDVITIYSESEEAAIQTLHHEFIDRVFADAIKPYQDMVNLHRVLLNSVFKYIQDDAYARKEQAIDALVKLLETRSRVKVTGETR